MTLARLCVICSVSAFVLAGTGCRSNPPAVTTLGDRPIERGSSITADEYLRAISGLIGNQDELLAAADRQDITPRERIYRIQMALFNCVRGPTSAKEFNRTLRSIKSVVGFQIEDITFTNYYSFNHQFDFYVFEISLDIRDGGPGSVVRVVADKAYPETLSKDYKYDDDLPDIHVFSVRPLYYPLDLLPEEQGIPIEQAK